MLIKVTNQCAMGCSHCMEDSRPRTGQHMTEAVFKKALTLTARVESMAWQLGSPRGVLLSGGECTEHPEFFRLLHWVHEAGMFPVLLTSGMWLHDPMFRRLVLMKDRPVFVTVTHDARFYPTAPPNIDDDRVKYTRKIEKLIPLGRAALEKNQRGVPRKAAPGSFNFRSLVRAHGDIRAAVAALRLRSALFGSGQCTPSITHEGHVVAGETRSCFRIGTVESSNEELTKAVLGMKCNACGLEDNLTPEQKRAIGAGDAR